MQTSLLLGDPWCTCLSAWGPSECFTPCQPVRHRKSIRKQWHCVWLQERQTPPSRCKFLPDPSRSCFFSRMRSEGFSFYIWGSGVDPCSRDPAFGVRNRSQPSATVRLRPSWAQSCRAYGKSRKNVTFRRVRRCGHVVLRGRRGTSWHSNMCHDASKSRFCVAGAILLLHFQKMCCSIRCRCSTLDTSDVIFRGRHSTLDVSCCVFSVDRIVSAARSGDKVQIPWQAWHFVTCHENRRKPRTKRRFCSRSTKKIAGKRWFWRCEVWKLPCLWEKSQKHVLFGRVRRCASVVLRGRRGTLWHSTWGAYGKSRTNVSLSTCHKMLSCRFAWQAWHFVTLHTLHFTLHTPHSALSTSHFTLHTLHSTLYTAHTPHIPHFTLHTPHSTLHTSHSTLHTLHFTLYTPHSTLPTPLHTLFFTHHTPHSPLHTLSFSLHTPLHFTLHTSHSTLYTSHSTLHTPHFLLSTPQFILHTPHSLLSTPHFILHTPHSTLPSLTLHSILYFHTLHSTLHTYSWFCLPLHRFTLRDLHSGSLVSLVSCFWKISKVEGPILRWQCLDAAVPWLGRLEMPRAWSFLRVSWQRSWRARSRRGTMRTSRRKTRISTFLQAQQSRPGSGEMHFGSICRLCSLCPWSFLHETLGYSCQLLLSPPSHKTSRGTNGVKPSCCHKRQFIRLVASCRKMTDRWRPSRHVFFLQLTWKPFGAETGGSSNRRVQQYYWLHRSELFSTMQHVWCPGSDWRPFKLLPLCIFRPLFEALYLRSRPSFPPWASLSFLEPPWASLSSLSLFEPLWASLSLFELPRSFPPLVDSLWFFLTLFEPFWSSFDCFWPSFDCFWPSLTLSDPLWPSLTLLRSRSCLTLFLHSLVQDTWTPNAQLIGPGLWQQSELAHQLGIHTGSWAEFGQALHVAMSNSWGGVWVDVIGSLSALTAPKSKVQGSGGMASFIAGTPYAIGALLRLCGVGHFNKLVQGGTEVGVTNSQRLW